MKYFTREIWAGWNRSTEEAVRANKQFERNRKRYFSNLKVIAARLGKNAESFFTRHSLHDGRLILFEIRDCANPKRRGILETTVNIVVLASTSPRLTPLIYELSYTQIDEIRLNSQNDLFALVNSRFGDWGYDELLPAGRNGFRHNMLFQTGTEISITFEKFKFKVRKARKNEKRFY